MTDDKILKDLEFLYIQFMDKGNFEKAQETLLKITDMKSKTENKNSENGNILLG